MTELTDAQLWEYSYYRGSELTGALLVGRLARRVTDPDLTVYFTEQCAEEAKHAWLWTKAIVALGAKPLQIKETHQSMYARLSGIPVNLLDILACTKVFEEHVHRYFTEEAQKPSTAPLIVETIDAILADEADHISGVDAILLRVAAERGSDAVAERVRHYEEVDARAYDLVAAHRERPWELLHLQE